MRSPKAYHEHVHVGKPSITPPILRAKGTNPIYSIENQSPAVKSKPNST